MSGRRTRELSNRAASPVRSKAYTLTFATGSRAFQLRLPRAVWAAVFAVLPLVGLLYLAATAYWMCHDDLLASLMRRQIDMQYSYEDRIGLLRHEIESLTLRARSEEARFRTDMQSLTRRQIEAENRTALLVALSERMKSFRLAEPKAAEDTTKPEKAKSPGEEINPLVNAAAPSSLTESARDNAPAAPLAPVRAKPHPERLDLRLNDEPESVSQNRPPAEAPLLSQIPPDQPGRLAAAYDRLDIAQMRILGNLLVPAQRAGEAIRTALATAGLTADTLAAAAMPRSQGRGKAESSLGGPFVPLPIGDPTKGFTREAVLLQTALDRSENLRRLLPHIPLRRPLFGAAEITSNFGPRIDPFLGRPAMHTGIDLRDDWGAPVRATAAGVVVFAGPNAGYGNMVDVDHGNGLSTRYAHLSSVLVAEDQKVDAGTILGRIGTTGRSTGPHLHYETRIDGEPVDPERFLRAGALLYGPATLPR